MPVTAGLRGNRLGGVTFQATTGANEPMRLKEPRLPPPALQRLNHGSETALVLCVVSVWLSLVSGRLLPNIP